MSLKERTINVDIMTKEYTKLKYKQGDSNQILKFKFYKNGTELDLSGYVAGIFYEKSNNEVLEKTGNINGNIVTTTITSGILNTSGVVKTEIFLTKNDEVSISFSILIEVDASIDKNAAVQEKEEWDIIKDLLTGTGGTSIDDNTTSTNKTWSSSKIDSQIKDIANNPIIIDILKRLNDLEGSNVSERPSAEAEPTMNIIKKYSAYYLRTKWNDTYDMLEQIAPTKGSNGQFNFTSSYLIEAATADKSIDSATKTTVKNSADDACPLCVNNGYVGGNHGYDFNIKATVTGHDKTEADIGSIWVDENSVNFTLIKIVDANNIYFISDDTSSDGTWEFTKTLGTTLTHVSGATNTSTITVESSGIVGLFPSINNYSYTMKTNKGDLSMTASFETAEATYLEITETYNIMEPNDMLSKLKANVGNNTNDSFHDNAIDSVVIVTNKYHFRPNGSCSLYTKYEVKKKLVLSKNPVLLGYIGFTQTQQMPKPTGGTWNLYIPDINPISGVEYDTSVAQVAKIPTTYIGNCKNDKVASRLTQYYTDSDNAICNNYGFTSGYNTDLYLGRHEVRKNNVNRIFNSGTKMYISGISAGSTNYDSYVNAGEVLEMVSFRINENYSKNPDFTSCNYYYVGDDIYYNIAIHKDFEGKIPVIGAMYGMDISVVENNGNVVITDEYVKTSGIGITVTNNYGYVILKLTKRNI